MRCSLQVLLFSPSLKSRTRLEPVFGSIYKCWFYTTVLKDISLFRICHVSYRPFRVHPCPERDVLLWGRKPSVKFSSQTSAGYGPGNLLFCETFTQAPFTPAHKVVVSRSTERDIFWNLTAVFIATVRQHLPLYLISLPSHEPQEILICIRACDALSYIIPKCSLP